MLVSLDSDKLPGGRPRKDPGETEVKAGAGTKKSWGKRKVE